jgi:hypothetical protein
MDLVKRLAAIQESLKVPKNQVNEFGGYNFRNLEDIEEAVKPLLKGLILTFSDGVESIGGHLYVVATAKITDGKDELLTTGYARETIEKKKFDSSQLTGSASSYARKYAANGMFLIDDNKDSDFTNTGGRANKNINLSAIAKKCGYTDQEVCETFTPPLKTINDVQDKDNCANWLRGNKK